MIQFFRRIRQNLLSEGKTGKYFKYAIGEILLVVIGILIALQVNNWNISVQNRKLEKQTLTNLKSDLVLQAEMIKEQLDFENHILEVVDSCFMMIQTNIDIETLDDLLESLSERKTFVANSVTFEGLGSNDGASLITNAELRNEIVSYYQLLEYTKSVINNNNLFRVNSQFGAFVVNNTLGFRLNPGGELDLSYVMSPEHRFALKKQLDGRRYSSMNNIEKSIIQKDKTQALIELIDNELN